MGDGVALRVGVAVTLGIGVREALGATVPVALGAVVPVALACVVAVGWEAVPVKIGVASLPAPPDTVAGAALDAIFPAVADARGVGGWLAVWLSAGERAQPASNNGSKEAAARPNLLSIAFYTPRQVMVPCIATRIKGVSPIRVIHALLLPKLPIPDFVSEAGWILCTEAVG